MGAERSTLVTTLSFLPWLISDLATARSMRWMVLLSSSYKPSSTPSRPIRWEKKVTNLRAGNVQLNLPPMRAHERSKLLHNALQQTQPVVLRQRIQEVLEDAVLVGGGATGNPLELGHDLLLIRGAQGRRVQDGGELGILLEDGAQLCQGFGDVL